MGSVSIPVVAAVGSEAAADGAAAAGTAATIAATTTATSVGTVGALSGAAAASQLGAAIGSSSIFTLGNAAAAAGAIGSGVSAYGSHMQGVATSNMDKQKARVESLSAAQKQIDMRQKMLSSLASQNAGTLGAVGTGRGSGFGANAMRQITQSQNDLMANSANSSAQVSLLDQGAANAGAAGNIGAAGDALGGASGLIKNGNF
jgi:hypothetical protein